MAIGNTNASIVGGTKVVTELPKVGEGYMVYELQETKVADFPWLLTEIDSSKSYTTPKIPLLVVETEEEVTYENLNIRSFEANQYIGVYVKPTNKVYRCKWEYGKIVEPGDPDYTFIKEEVIPKDNTYNIEKTKFVILKDFDYHCSSGDESDILDGIGHFLDGTEFVYNFFYGAPLVLTDATDKKIVLDEESLTGISDVTDEELPPFVVQVSKIDLSLAVTEGTYVFAPQSSKQVSTYWIYTNNEWVNVDEAGHIGTLYVRTDSFVDLALEKFYANGKELEVKFVETSPEGAEWPTGYAIIKGVSIDEVTNLTVSIWPTNGIMYNDQYFSQGPVEVLGAGVLSLSYMVQ